MARNGTFVLCRNVPPTVTIPNFVVTLLVTLVLAMSKICCAPELETGIPPPLTLPAFLNCFVSIFLSSDASIATHLSSLRSKPSISLGAVYCKYQIPSNCCFDSCGLDSNVELGVDLVSNRRTMDNTRDCVSISAFLPLDVLPTDLSSSCSSLFFAILLLEEVCVGV